MSKFNTHIIPLTSLSLDPSSTAYPHDKREIGVCGGGGEGGREGERHLIILCLGDFKIKTKVKFDLIMYNCLLAFAYLTCKMSSNL